MTLEELAEAARTVEHTRRIVICPVGLGLQVEALVLRYNMDRLWTVRESALCMDKILLINEPEELADGR
jgi:hypothetical protein